MSDDGFLCWFCPICQTLTLLAKAEQGECCHTPRRADCPLAHRMTCEKCGAVYASRSPITTLCADCYLASPHYI